MRPPAKKECGHILVSTELLDRIRARAKAEGVSMRSLVDRVVREQLDHEQTTT